MCLDDLTAARDPTFSCFKFMFPFCRATTSRLTNVRTLAAVSVKQGTSPRVDAVQNLLKQHARLLRLVEKRVNKRAKLQSEVLKVFDHTLLITHYHCSFHPRCRLQRT